MTYTVYKLVVAHELPDEIVLFVDLSNGNVEGAVLRTVKLSLGGDCAEVLLDTMTKGAFTDLLNCDKFKDKQKREACFTDKSNNLYQTKVQAFPMPKGDVKLDKKNDVTLDLFSTQAGQATLTMQSRAVRKRVRLVRGWNAVRVHLGPFPGRHRLTITVRRGRKSTTYRHVLKVARASAHNPAKDAGSHGNRRGANP